MLQLEALKPEALWRHFSALCHIPRPSGHEQAVCEHIRHFGEQLGLETLRDSTGNIIIRKPATAGMEDRPGVILQGHVDMVPQKNADTDHDFIRDPITVCMEGPWVTARGTTLGADNGIGVAAAMAVLEARDIEHGPLEALFTVDEESGMTGARNLKAGLLQGQILLNLDSEDEGRLCVGCAGGVDLVIQGHYSPEAAPADYLCMDIALTGLKGGHSGVDIHLQRGNANKLMVRLLKELTALGGALVCFKGGSLRNAIPREAFVTLALPADREAQAQALVEHQLAAFKAELTQAEAADIRLSLSRSQASATGIMPMAEQVRWLDALHVSPNGVHRMSLSLEGIVETSNNLAIVTIGNGRITVENMVRSLVDSVREEHAKAISGLYHLLGGEVHTKGAYPGWKPNPASSLLKTMTDVHKALFGREAEIDVIHAGLECGLLGHTYPHWEMISFGPTIRFPHSPDEKVHTGAVENFWRYLLAVLKAV